jgi:tape measure domain-containing protein
VAQALEFEAKVSANELNKLLRDLQTGAEGAAKAVNDALGGTVTKKLVLETVTDVNGARSLVAVERERLSVAGAIENQYKQIQKVERGSVTSLRQQVNEAKQARDQIAKYEASIGALGGKVQRVTDAWAAQNTKVQQLQRSLDLATASGFWDRAKTSLNAGGLISFANGLTQITNGLQSASIVVGQISSSINNLINALGGLQSFRLAFDAVGQGAGGASLALAESSRIALGLGVDLNTVRQGFQQLTPVVLNSGGTIGDVSNVVEALSSRFAAFGIAGDRARRVTNGIIQAFAKGKLQAEELTQQISEADPAFKTDLAGAIGVSVAQLEELVKAGEITGEVLLQAIPKIGKTSLLFGRLGTSAIDAAESLATSGTTVDQVRSKLQTISQLSLERFAKSVEPVLFAFIRLGAVITDSLDRISKLEAIKTIGSFAGGVAQSFGKIAEALFNFAEAGLAVADVILRVVKPLLEIPGATDVVAVAIASKLIGPLANLKSAFGQSVTSATGWGKAVRAATTFSGLSEAIRGIGKGAISTSVQLQQLSESKIKLERGALKAEAAIGRLQARIKGYQSIIAGQKALPDFAGNAAAQSAVERYTQKIEKAKTAIEKLRNGLEKINQAQATTSAGLTQLANKKGVAARAAGLLDKTLSGVGTAGKNLLNVLGPLGTILAAIAVFTSAYRTANQSSNNILDESRQRVESLQAALKDLGASTKNQEKPITGLALVWEKFSFVVSDVIDTIKRPFEGISSGATDASGGVDTLSSRLGLLAQAALTGAAAGATIGTIFGGIGAGPGAAVGALAATLVALAAAGDDAGLKTRKLQEDLEATETSIVAETEAINQLIVGLDQLNSKDLDVDSVKTIAGFNQAQTALKTVGRTIDTLKLQQGSLNQEAAALAPAASKGINAYKAVYAQQKRVDELANQIKNVGGWDKAPTALRKAAFSAGAELKILKQRAEEIAKTDPGSKKYLELQTRIKAVNGTLERATESYNKAQAAADKFAAANGFLTSEQKKVTPTIAGSTEKIKELTTALQADLNPKSNPEKWRQISNEIANQTVVLNGLNDELAASVNREVIVQIKAQVQSGQIANSVENARRLIQALEQQSVLIDVNSPELPGVLRGLFDAKTNLDNLNGRRADITIAIIEQTFSGGGLTGATLSQLDFYLEQLNQKKVTIPVGSEGIDQVIGQINQVSALRDASNRTSAQLERTLTQEVFSERAQAIRDEQSLQNQIYDERIERLRGLTPAEERLAELRRSELAERAAAGDVEAQAQLERLDREKEINRIRQEQRDKEKTAQNELKGLSEEEKKLQKDARKDELDAAQKVLDARRAGKTLLEESVTPARGVASQMSNAATDAERIASAIKGLDGFTATIRVNRIPGRWTGGPVSSGQAYQVNELGQEGFLSAGGRLSAINKPKNALWRAPSSGTVIPAHIWSGLDVPSGGVKTSARPMTAGSGGNGLQRVVRAIQSSLTQPRESSNSMHELATVQARQALEIGKLSRAVNRLADKDHSVNVSVRNTGGAAYLNALSRNLS